MSASRNEAQRDDLSGFRRRLAIVMVAVTVVGFLVLTVIATYRVLPLAFLTILLAVFLRGTAETLSRLLPIPASTIVFIVIIALVVSIGLFLRFAGPRVATELSTLTETIPEALGQLDDQIREYAWGRELLDNAGSSADMFTGELNVLSGLTGWFSNTISLLTNLALVLVAGIYMAYEPSLYTTNFVRLFPRPYRARIAEVLAQVYDILKRWLTARVIAMVVIGVLSVIGLTVIGIPLAFTLGVVAGLLSFIPSIGPILGAIPAVLVALTIGPSQAVIVVLLYTAIQFVENYFITPFVERQTVSLFPALTMLAQILLALLLGWLGLFIAAPLVATSIVLVKSLYIEDVLGDEVGPIAGSEDEGKA
jgi:predicted PurR-regulated permease PerM